MSNQRHAHIAQRLRKNSSDLIAMITAQWKMLHISETLLNILELRYPISNL